MNVIELDRATIGIGGRERPCRRKLCDPRRRIHRRARAQRRRQDDADARHSRPACRRAREPCACSGGAPQRGDPAIGYLPQVRTVLPDLRVRGLDFIAISLHGERWGLPSLTSADRRMIEETLAAVGARELAERPIVRHVRRRAAAAAAGAGADRRTEAAAARRAADQPRPAPPGSRHRRRAQASAASATSPCCSARMSSTSCSARSTACSISATARPCSAPSTKWSPRRCSRALYGTEIKVLRADGHIFVMSRGRDVERADHLHDHGHDHGHDHSIITDMFQYEFMINAFAAAGIVAVVSGLVGFFLVMRGQTFAGHALSHIGFAGATGAGLIGLAPLWGLIGFTLAAGDRHGHAQRAHQQPRRRHRRCAGAGARLRPAVPALLYVVRDAGDGAAVRQRARGRSADDRDAGRARRSSRWPRSPRSCGR